ncbi:MAG: aminopeptidase [Nitrososphaerales archaeon]
MGTIQEGARSAVKTCMGVTRQDKVLIVSDIAQQTVGKVLRQAAQELVGENVKLFILEDYAQRPLKELPKEILDSVPWATVTFWAASSLPGELTVRAPFIRLAIKNARHGHMPNITPLLMEQGMCADYEAVYNLTHKIYDIVKDANKIEIENPKGAKIVSEFEKSWRWIPSDGKYHEKGKWGNLPEGETFTAPKNVNGHFVTNLLGDWFSEKYGNFKDPLSFDVIDSRIDFSSIRCNNSKLRGEITEYLRTDENSNRASEFALPTNPLLISLPTIGNLLQDEKARPHIAFGNPYPDETGANWTSKTHVDLLLEQCNVTVDGRKIMEKGNYIV